MWSAAGQLAGNHFHQVLRIRLQTVIDDELSVHLAASTNVVRHHGVIKDPLPAGDLRWAPQSSHRTVRVIWHPKEY